MVCAGVFGCGNVVVDKYKHFLAIYRCFFALYTNRHYQCGKMSDIYKPLHDNRSNKQALKTLCLQYDKPSVGVRNRNAVIQRG